MSAPFGASAPGKLMVAGEYAVLGGHPALVMAVRARARAIWSGSLPDGSSGRRDHSPGDAPPAPEALLARERAEKVCGTVPDELTLDVRTLRRSGRKLGLGSSAAASAAAAGAVFAWHGHDLGEPGTRRAVFDAALAGHRAVSPEGSGADVAAAAFGGLLRFTRDPTSEGVSVSPLTWPAGLALRVVWTGREARTSGLVAAVNRLEAGARARLFAGIAEAATRMADAFARDDGPAALDGVAAHHAAMAALGEAAGAPIVEDRLDAIARLARAHGGAAKPSGAGGGDVALAFFADPAGSAAFDAAATASGFDVLTLDLDADGVRALDPASDQGASS